MTSSLTNPTHQEMEARRLVKSDLEVITLQMPASRIPHGSKVAKRTGDKEYTLARRLSTRLLANDEPLNVVGCFLIAGASITQVQDDLVLAWRVQAFELRDQLNYALDPDQYCPQ